jgi:hypothetical protein
MAVAPQLGVFLFVALEQVENFQSRMPLERLGEKIVQTLSALAVV